MKVFNAFGLVVAISVLSSVHAQEHNASVSAAKPLEFTRIYADSMGASHFSTETMTFSLTDFAPPLPPVSVASPNATSSLVVISAPAGGVADWHPVPRRQFNIILSAEVEVEVSDGEVRRFGPGSLILGEDTEGKGHITRVVSSTGCYFAVVALATK